MVHICLIPPTIAVKPEEILSVYAVGIDIGGTKIAGAVVDNEGHILAHLSRPSPALDAQAMVDTVVDLIEELSRGRRIVAAGVAAAGFIDADQSVVYYAPNIAWRNEPLREKLERRVALPIVVENDANAAGWAEFCFGAGRNVTHMTMLTIGTGVGGAIIVDGELFRGGFGAGAEIGHLRVERDGLLCGCGARGCLEQYGSGRALLRYAAEISHDPVLGGKLAAYRHGDGTIDPAGVRQLLELRDPGALRALRSIGEWLGSACASLSAVLDPQLFVIGGGVAAAGDELLSPIRASFLQNLSAKGFHPEPEFAIAELVNDAGVVGAADLARRHAASV
ncbi:ROK family glucokinase [Alpinimonas psychrophila]|uniref:Glucokinase n=1 Tax=Alpinimonas psychrophila TaxID=748908 RepID=A0A7W3JSC2_9MICO|nr:ROK family glucokinase [Alpinimonas psychrophila]MBA8828343.1 glucokinase [Alpinimonas psychrophila]